MNFIDKVFLVFLLSFSLYGHYILLKEGCKNGQETGKNPKAPTQALPVTALRPTVRMVPFYQDTVLVKFIEMEK